MSIFVDTSVWSGRDAPSSTLEVRSLMQAVEAGETVLTTGLVLQELLQGFSGARNRAKLLDRFSAVPLLVPTRDDHIAAADLRNRCRRAGVQIGTIDALLAQLCLHHDLVMLSNDEDFKHIAGQCALKLWR